jgi:hypothetical protein
LLAAEEKHMNTQEAAVEKKALKVFAGGLRAWGREVWDCLVAEKKAAKEAAMQAKGKTAGKKAATAEDVGKGAASKATVFKNV